MIQNADYSRPGEYNYAFFYVLVYVILPTLFFVCTDSAAALCEQMGAEVI